MFHYSLGTHHQVVSNLLTTAAKCTPLGGTIVLGSRVDRQGLMVFVRDDGIGLAPDELKIFNMFTRVDSTADRAEGGLGIGLALAKRLGELHGGRIEARSPGLGQGSKLTVSLPESLLQHTSSPMQVSAPPATAPLSLRVLIADDNRDVAEALEVASYRPDVAVLDISMPVLNGYEVAKCIRREAWRSQLTLIAVTGWGQANDRRATSAAGFDHHVTKPVDPEQLARLLADENPG